MNDLARTKLADIVNSYGKTVCNTPRTCEIFLNQHCGDLPEERDLLSEALRRGVVSRLLENKEKPYLLVATELIRELTEEAGIPKDDARWAVDSWALALGKHPSTAPPPEPVISNAIPEPTEEEPCRISNSKIWAPLIVALGGSVGAVLATLVLTFLIYTLISHPHHSGVQVADAVALVAGLMMAFAAALGASAGAAGGWLLIQAQTIPPKNNEIARWRLVRGCLAACGGAFGATLLGGWFGGLFGIALGGLMGAFSGSVVTGLKG